MMGVVLYCMVGVHAPHVIHHLYRSQQPLQRIRHLQVHGSAHAGDRPIRV